MTQGQVLWYRGGFDRSETGSRAVIRVRRRWYGFDRSETGSRGGYGFHGGDTGWMAAREAHENNRADPPGLLFAFYIYFVYLHSHKTQGIEKYRLPKSVYDPHNCKTE